MRGIFLTIIFLTIVVFLIPLFILKDCHMSIPGRNMLKPQTIESDLSIIVFNHDTKENMQLELEDYIVGVVAAEAPAAFEMEALKAQAVAARTYALWRRSVYGDGGCPEHLGAIVCTSHLHCQAWLSMEELEERHGKKWMKKYLPRIEEAVASTRGVIMTYNMQLIEPLYHSTSGGITENSEDVFARSVPYLRSVSSPYEEDSPAFVDSYKITVKDFVAKIKGRYKDFKIDTKKVASEINILERSKGGNVKRIKIGNKELTGGEIRELFELRSADFSIEVKGKDMCFTTKGYGHGVGMSQWGANGMAKQGSTFTEILKHYYQGVSLSVLKSHRDN
ncbi:MAG: stage II sporulation protein D [Candidatus Alkaliphilus sp. MAG34]|nr:stage II sporulation protein D [Clostridiales bacterium]